jgi:YidC/Oxa1 family membrane protein insertase
MNPITWLVNHIMMPFLTFSYNSIYPNYGVAIILLTIVVKVVFYPLNNKQYASMQAQKKIQPELKKIQEKYKDQPEKLNKEMMKLWKDNKANPFSGCLPVLIQMPFFFAIFYTIRSEAFKAMIAQPGVNPGLFPFWLSDLGLPDSSYILPVVIGLTMYLSQKMTVTDPKQAKMFMFMPFVMVFICINLPAGVLLYWAISQTLSIVQQKYMLRGEAEEVINCKAKTIEEKPNRKKASENK